VEVLRDRQPPTVAGTILQGIAEERLASRDTTDLQRSDASLQFLNVHIQDRGSCSTEKKRERIPGRATRDSSWVGVQSLWPVAQIGNHHVRMPSGKEGNAI